MKKFKKDSLIALVLLACLLSVIGMSEFSSDTDDLDTKEEFGADYSENSDLIIPLKAPEGLSKNKINLGRRLFNEPALSHNNTVSCATCHKLSHGGADNKKFPTGIEGKEGDVNTPTIINAGYFFRQFWDGRTDTLEAQIDGPVTNPKEMGSNWDEVVAKLGARRDYQIDFQKAFEGSRQITPAKIKDAIATYERSLVSVGAPFDQYLKGDFKAINALELKGYEMFKSYGCVSCHQGQAIGGNMYEKFGLIGDFFKDRGNIKKADLGLYNTTGRLQDKHVFKVPSLRNIALTAPYFHDGSAETLEEAVKIMARYQLGRMLNQEEITAITAFLKTLTGKQPQ